MPIDPKYIPSLIPTGTYKIEFTAMTKNNDTIYKTIAIADIENRLLEFW